MRENVCYNVREQAESDQPAQLRRLIRVFPVRLHHNQFLKILEAWKEKTLISRRGCTCLLNFICSNMR